jgi:hypothetical protein
MPIRRLRFVDGFSFACVDFVKIVTIARMPNDFSLAMLPARPQWSAAHHGV